MKAAEHGGNAAKDDTTDGEGVDHVVSLCRSADLGKDQLSLATPLTRSAGRVALSLWESAWTPSSVGRAR